VVILGFIIAARKSFGKKAFLPLVVLGFIVCFLNVPVGVVVLIEVGLVWFYKPKKKKGEGEDGGSYDEEL
jgi:4-hydroxybenzoate polyprenyltransferase